VEIHGSARRHGVADEGIRHAVANAMAVDDQDDDTRLYLIHAMAMRPKYRPLLPGD
jgi:hypothetical protein